MSSRRGNDRNHHADPRITGEGRDTEADFASNDEVKSTLRQVGVAPDRVVAFAYRLEDLIFIDLRLQCVVRGPWQVAGETSADGDHPEAGHEKYKSRTTSAGPPFVSHPSVHCACWAL